MGSLAVITPAAVVPQFSMSDMERVALAIAKGGLFGSNDPNAVLTLCMLAQAEGQHPAVVFRDYHIISGKPAKKAEAMQRDFLAAGGKIEWHRLDDECVDATFSHPAGGSARISWDDARVAKAELGSNKMHKKFPRQMKKARVVSEGVRTVYPSATSGLYESGEVQDMASDQPSATPAAPQPQRARDLHREQPALAERDRAAEWVEAHIARVDAAPTTSDLLAVIDGGIRRMTELEDKRPELYARARQAERAREQSFATERRPDDAYGDQHDGEGE